MIDHVSVAVRDLDGNRIEAVTFLRDAEDSAARE